MVIHYKVVSAETIYTQTTIKIAGCNRILVHAYAHIHIYVTSLHKTIIIKEKEAINLRSEHGRSLRGDFGGARGSKWRK